MTAHQQPSTWQDQLSLMGFTKSEISRAIEAGSTNVDQAIDSINEYHSSMREQQQRQQPANITEATVESSLTSNIQEFPPLSSNNSNPNDPYSSSLTQNTNRTTKFTNAKDSLDRINSNKNAFSTNSPDTRSASSMQNTVSNTDDPLQKALELSRQEAEERDTSKAMQLSMAEMSNKTEEQQIARAIHLSTQENHTNFGNDQDQDLLRAMEESLKENTPSNTNRNVSWQNVPTSSPKDRLRSDLNQPVGLRNIGNTCYLNSLLQVYFHLSNFRRAIMSFRATHDFENQFLQHQSNVIEDSSKPTPTPRDSYPDLNVNTNEDYRPQVNDIETWPEQEEISPQTEQQHENPENQNDRYEESTVQPMSLLGPTEKREAEAVIFVIELQRLFAAMALGNENCVDPTHVARAMRDSDGNPIKIGAQQDASEFNHMFLDIVERGLQSQRFREISDKECTDNIAEQEMKDDEQVIDSNTRENVVKDMFTIKFHQEISRQNEENVDTNPADENLPISNGETNCIIVDATSYTNRDLHSGLQDYTYTKIESADASPRGSTTTIQIVQENNPSSSEKGEPDNSPMETEESLPSNNMMKRVWLTSLPPIIVIYLQRVKFNRTTANAEKVCDRYDFASKVAMDRYLKRNRTDSMAAMKKLLAMRAEKARILNLRQQVEYFSGDEIENEPEIQAGQNKTTTTRVEQQSSSEVKKESIFRSVSRVRARLKEILQPSSSMFATDNISETQIQTSLDLLDTLMQHDKRTCDRLREELSNLETEDFIYRDLNNITYNLHAVLVHEGAPSSGHYWTFIRNWSATEKGRKWMRLSDSVLSYVSDADMFQWSLGGHGTACAYCLIYTTASSSSDDEYGNSQNIAEESRNLLCSTRLREIDEQSEKFTQELGDIPN